MYLCVCVWGCLDKYISVATWPPKQKFLAPPLIPSTCTQNIVLSNFSVSTRFLTSYHSMTTRCLSKFHGSPWMIFSTLDLSSKTNSILWSPIFRILKPLRDHHSGVKVLVIESMFKARLVIKFAANTTSWELRSLSKQQPGPSMSDRERRVQFLVSSFILIWDENWRGR